MVEEYSLSTDELLERRFRRRTTLGGEGDWEIDVGEPAPAPVRPGGEAPLLMAASSSPIFVRTDKRDAFVWRIRNLPYPSEVYKLSVEGDEIVLRTTNKKYYKRWRVNDLAELKVPLDPARLSCSYASNTLVVTYAKPLEILQYEEQKRRERATMKPSSLTKEDDCKTS